MHVELAGRILQRVGLSVGIVETNGARLVELQPSNQLKVKLESDSLILIFYFFPVWPLFTYTVGYCKLQICINSAVIQNGRRGRGR